MCRVRRGIANIARRRTPVHSKESRAGLFRNPHTLICRRDFSASISPDTSPLTTEAKPAFQSAMSAAPNVGDLGIVALHR